MRLKRCSIWPLRSLRDIQTRKARCTPSRRALLRELGRDAEATKAAAEARRLSDSFQESNKDGARESHDGNQ